MYSEKEEGTTELCTFFYLFSVVVLFRKRGKWRSAVAGRQIKHHCKLCSIMFWGCCFFILRSQCPDRHFVRFLFAVFACVSSWWCSGTDERAMYMCECWRAPTETIVLCLRINEDPRGA